MQKMIFFTSRSMIRQVVFWHWEIAPQQTSSSVLITREIIRQETSGSVL